jgi:hypothetical protein
MLKYICALVTLSLSIFVYGCGGSGDLPTVPQAQPAAASDVDIGDHVVHFNAQSTDMLSPEVARAYGIVRSKNRAMLTVSVLEESTAQGVQAEITVRAVNLAGQLKNVTMRRVPEQEAIYYIGETGISNRETLTFTISITPEGITKSSVVTFTREFFTN